MKQRFAKLSPIVILIIFILVGFWLRLYHLDTVPLRGDEGFSALFWSGLPLKISLTEIATIEPHPPLTYVFFRLWGLVFGIDTPFVLRLFPALINLLGIPALYALGTQLGNRKVGLLAAFLWAVHPFQIWHSQDFRNYAIWSGLSSVALWLGVRGIHHKRRADWLLYSLVAFITAMVFYMELLMIGVLGLYAIFTTWSDWKFLIRWLGSQAIIVLITLASFLVLQGDVVGSGTYTGTISGLEPMHWFTRFIPTLTFGDTLPPDVTRWLWITTLTILMVAWVIVWHQNRKTALLLGMVAVIPMALLGMISTRLNIFHPRYVISVIPAYILLGSFLILWLGDRKELLAKILAGGLLVSTVGMMAYSLNTYFFNSQPKAPDWVALTDYLEASVTGEELVIQLSVDPAFGYYYDAPAYDIGLPHTPKQTPEEIIEIMERADAWYDSIWIIGRTLDGIRGQGVVEAWAQANMQLIRATETRGIPIWQYMDWDIPAEQFPDEPLAVFDNIAELIQVEIPSNLEPTEQATVIIYWRPLQQTDNPLKIFLHAYGEFNPSTSGPIWTQDDQFPQEGRIASDTWEIGKIYRDVYVLPTQNVPDAIYELAVGFYDPETNTRLQTTDGSDNYALGLLTIER